MLIASSGSTGAASCKSRRSRAWASSSCHHSIHKRPMTVMCAHQGDLASTSCHGHAHTQSDEPACGRLARRQILLGIAVSSLLGVSMHNPIHAAAEEVSLPKAYKEVVRKLSSSLKESIQAEQAGDSESEVRRKADPAKEALQTFVKRWRDDPKVKGHPSHQSVIAVLSELSAFYSKAGPRARMPLDVQTRLIAYLDAAEQALKPVPTSAAGSDEDDLRSLLPT